MISECCGASPYYDGSDLCGDCKENTEFINEDDLNN